MILVEGVLSFQIGGYTPIYLKWLRVVAIIVKRYLQYIIKKCTIVYVNPPSVEKFDTLRHVLYSSEKSNLVIMIPGLAKSALKVQHWCRRVAAKGLAHQLACDTPIHQWIIFCGSSC